MRSSIACIRCRRSKVKCVNSGVGTTCRACENAGRECTYPAPVLGFGRRRESIATPSRADASAAAATNTAATTTTTNAAAADAAGATNIVGSGSGGVGGGGGSSGVEREPASERRQRARKNPSQNFSTPQQLAGARGSPRPPRPPPDALDPRLLTPAVWQDLFDIFQTHYSADLPFLHPPTFLRPLRAASIMRPASSTTPAGEGDGRAVRPPGSPAFLLAFLALTARFHPALVAHHSPPSPTQPSNPLVASQFYAAAATERLSVLWSSESGGEIERTQALLMLGLHEWGMCAGARAWLTVGAAIRSAQALGLQFEADLNDEPWSRSLALGPDADRTGDLGLRRRTSDPSPADEAEEFIRQETRRRTFWSCYIMDRHLSSGVYRPQMLRVSDLRIQLPASERSFLFAEKVRTLMLGEEERRVGGRQEVQSRRQASINLGSNGRSDFKRLPPFRQISQPHNNEDERGRVELASDEGLTSRYVKILDIYGRVVKWACSGGRQTEQFPPWDLRCGYHQLRRQCLDFKASLPRQHQLNPQNTQAHISLKTATPYALVHVIYLLCQIILHREYLPFVPIQCARPEGPLDPPLFPPDRYDVPPRFWEESARECFKTARDIVELVRACRDWNAMVETPVFAFAVYNVAFLGAYAINFPWMDPDGYLCTFNTMAARPDRFPKRGESNGAEATRKAVEVLGSMRSRLGMADGWYKTAARTHKYFRRVSLSYRRTSSGLVEVSEAERPGSRENISDDIRLLERTFKEFAGPDEDEDEAAMAGPGVATGESPSRDAPYDDSSVIDTIKSEDAAEARAMNAQTTRSETGPWNAINASLSGQRGSISNPGGAQFRSFESYRPASQPSSSATPGQPNYPHQITNFRSTYSPHEGVPPVGQGPLPSASLSSPPPPQRLSQASPGPVRQRSPQYERSSYTGWATHQTQQQQQPPPPYQQQPSPAQYTNGPTQSVQAPSYPTPVSAHGPPLLQQQQQQQGQIPGTLHQQQPQVPYGPTPTTSEPLSSVILDTRLGADDLAAFIEGGDVAEWAALSAQRADGGGWLSTVWM